MPPQDPYAGLPPREAEALRRLDAEAERSRVTGDRPTAAAAAAAARARVAARGGRPEPEDEDRGARYPGFTAEARATVCWTPPPGVEQRDFWANCSVDPSGPSPTPLREPTISDADRRYLETFPQEPPPPGRTPPGARPAGRGGRRPGG